MKHKIVMVMLSVALIVSLVLTGCVEPAAPPTEPAEPAKPVEPVEPAEYRLLYGCGTQPTSGAYPLHLAINEVGNSTEGISSTLIVMGGSEAAATAIYAGEIDWGGTWGLSLFYESTRGLGKWEGNKQPNILRVLVRSTRLQPPIVVREDSGVTCVADLEGKKFSWGTPGSTTQTMCEKSFEALGIEIDPFGGGIADTVAAMKDGRIVGFIKNSPNPSLDSMILDVMATTPIRLIGFTDDEADKVQAKFSIVQFKKVPAGFYKQLPELEAFNVVSQLLALGCSTEMPEEAGYKLTKALVEEWDYMCQVWPSWTIIDPLTTAEEISTMEGVYLHAGSARYFREVGVDVPESVIPPEMK